MKKLLYLSLLLVGVPCFAAITLSQTVKHGNAASTSVAVTITATGSGHDVCALVVGAPNSATVGSVATSGADTLSQVASTRATDATGNQFTDIWCKGGASSGLTTVTANCASCTNMGMYVYEITGAATASFTENPANVTNGAACTSCLGPNSTTTTANDLVLVVAIPQNSFTAAGGTGFTDDAGGTIGERASHNITTSTINMNTATFTQTSGTYCASGVGIKAAAAGTKTCTLALLGAGPC
jgi:hypothetical protein